MVRIQAQLEWVEVRMGGKEEERHYIDNSQEQLL